MAYALTDFVFFKSTDTVKKITHVLYKSSKISHDMRLGYRVLGQSVTDWYRDIPAWQSAKHLSYILPSISFFCSLIIKDKPFDKSALLWAVVNSLQCYIPLLTHSKTLTITAYSLDVFIACFHDKDFIATCTNTSPNRLLKYIRYGSETIYSILFLGTIIANLFDQPFWGLCFFAGSLLMKLVYLTRNSEQCSNSIIYAIILSFAPISFLFAVTNEYSMVFSLFLATFALYNISSVPQNEYHDTPIVNSQSNVIEQNNENETQHIEVVVQSNNTSDTLQEALIVSNKMQP